MAASASIDGSEAAASGNRLGPWVTGFAELRFSDRAPSLPYPGETRQVRSLCLKSFAAPKDSDPPK